jgi:hypothetical protein
VASAKLKGVFETIRKYSIPLVALDSDAPLESVCRVFETINSTGTRLLKEYEIDGERILQILSLYHLRENEKFPEATRSVLLSLEPNYIKANWERAVDHLSETCQWVKQLGATAKTQPPHGTLVSIAAALMCYPKALSKPELSTVLKKWYFCTTLAANPSPANNYKIGDDFRQFCDLLENSKTLSYPRVFFTPDELIEIKHITDSRYKAIQALMRTTVREDLITGNILNDNLEDHHIFPYSLGKSGLNKNRLNSIVNRIIISQESNRNISNTNPDKYLFDLITTYSKEGNIGDLERRLKNCFIPYDPKDSDSFKQKMSKEYFDTFLHDRASMIINRIQEVVGDAWKVSLETEDANLEDDEFVST